MGLDLSDISMNESVGSCEEVIDIVVVIDGIIVVCWVDKVSQNGRYRK